MNSAGMIRLRFLFLWMFKKGEKYAEQGFVHRYYCACVRVPLAFYEAFARRKCGKTGRTCRTGKGFRERVCEL
jgi:hypothetical protein